jgi:hypothetical protein
MAFDCGYVDCRSEGRGWFQESMSLGLKPGSQMVRNVRAEAWTYLRNKDNGGVR